MAIQASIENAKLIFKNFSGRGTDYNDEGNRNFNVVLDEDMAQAMIADGWNVTPLKSRNPEDPDGYKLKVLVKYHDDPEDNMPSPNIWLKASGDPVLLTSETVGQLDFAEIEKVDLVITQSKWSRAGRSGISAYVKNMYVKIVSDPFAERYFEQ